MNLDEDVCYEALRAHDARFDGLFYVGVTSTGIYCRPVCTAKMVLRKNCRFFKTAAAAERAGFRPCLRCRPELAPGAAPVDAAGRLASAAANRIDEGALSTGRLQDLAEELGVSARHLRRVMQSAFGVSPIQLAQTQRLLLAKRLLTDSALSITEIAFASGFSSLRRFNALFSERYRLNPTQLRKAAPLPGRSVSAEEPAAPALQCDLAYRPPLDWQPMLQFLAARCTPGVEAVRDGRYFRTIRIGKQTGWLAVSPSPGRNAMRLETCQSMAPALPALLGRARRMLDLNAEPQQVQARLGPLAAANPGLRLPGAFNAYEMAVRAILGQQVSVRAATTLAGRFAAAFGESAATAHPELAHLSPEPQLVASLQAENLTSLGIIPTRAAAILALSASVAEGIVSLEGRDSPEETMWKLKQIPGIGEWTAQYIAMRALSWPDAFPHTDLGIRKALGSMRPQEILAMAERWRPWRSYAALHLWKSLEEKK
ncbi:MAG TPA: DNA-3-methyladenine glycosylase 2 [Chthonomonadales bacterium]|nr:DNA-3-methyladenine glycosylase 2 [Chthonomonadales bacterium]